MAESPQRPRNVAVIGVGYWGRNLARNFAQLGALAAVVDTNGEAAREVASATDAEARSFEQVLAEPAIEALAVATRAETHFDLARTALEAGKHVFVEKPLVLDEAHADTLIALSERLGRVLMVGHLLRYHPVFERMLEMVRAGDYGRLRHVTSERLNLGKIRTEENVFWSFAPHDISMVLALVGEEPERITAAGTTFITPPIADLVAVELGFPSGVGASIRASWMHFRKVQQLVALCDRATIVFEDSEQEWGRKLAVHEHRVEIEGGIPVPRRGMMRYVDVPFEEPLQRECSHFLACVAGRDEVLTGGGEGRAVLRVLERATATMTTSVRGGQ